MKPTILRRAGARFIDVLILTAVSVAWGAPLHFSVLWLVITALLVYLYFVAADTMFGRTVGKSVLAIKVTASDGVSHPSLPQSLIREAVVLVGAVPYVGPLLALGCWIGIAVTANRDELGRGLHDAWAGGTLVVGRAR